EGELPRHARGYHRKYGVAMRGQRGIETTMPIPRAKEILAAPLILAYRASAAPREFFRRLRSYAMLRAEFSYPLPSTTVVLGRIHVFGTGRVRCGEGILLYP